MTSDKPHVRRLNAIIPSATYEQLQVKANVQGTTISELLRYALGLADYLEYAQRQGARVLVQWQNGERTEILPRIPSAPAVTLPLPAAAVAEIEVARGATGPVVYKLQHALKEQAAADPAVDPGELDGYFGEQTEAAVKAYQARHGFDVDGVAGEQTLTEPAPATGESLAATAGLVTA